MNRTELFKIAKKHNGNLAAIRQELLDYYRSEQGQEEIRNAPRIPVEFNNDFPLNDKPAELIVNLLMREVENYAKNG